MPERPLGISGRGLRSWTALRSQFAGVSPVNSVNAAPPPLFCTYDTVNGDGCPALLLEGPMTGEVGEGTQQSRSHPGCPAQLPVAKAECQQQPISCAGPHGAHLVAAPGSFTVAFIESD